MIFIKQCTKCQKILPKNEEYFYKSKTTKDGLTDWCKECRKQYQRQYKENNREEDLKKQREYQKKNKKKLNKRSREWAEENPNRNQNNLKLWHQNNPTKALEYNKRRRQHKKHNITKSEWENCKKYFNYQCAYCGLPLSEHYYTRKGITKLGDFHKEHVDHEGTNDLSNCIPSCGSCNNKKWEYKLDEWYNENNFRFRHERYDRIIEWITKDYKLHIEIHKPKRKYIKKVF